MTNCIKYKNDIKIWTYNKWLKKCKIYIIFILKNVAAQTGDTRSPSNVEVGTLQWICFSATKARCMCVHACVHVCACVFVLLSRWEKWPLQHVPPHLLFTDKYYMLVKFSACCPIINLWTDSTERKGNEWVEEKKTKWVKVRNMS